ncbi:MAG TPA: hypothetical protein VH764_12795 [Gemmatimonadales bacterium]
MPIYITMAYSHEPDPPAPADDRPPGAEPESGGTGSGGAPGDAAITPEQLAKVLRRLESGFYDRADVSERIARRLLDEPDQ